MPADSATRVSLPRMAVPLVISFTLRFLFQQVDLAYAAMLKDDPGAVAALGLYIPIQSVYIAVWVGLSAGFTASISAAFGRSDQARVRALQRSMRRLLWIVVPSLVAAGIGLWFVIPHLGLDAELTRAFRTYAPTLLVGVSLTGFWSVYPDSIVKAHYDTRSTMVAGILATATNIGLNTLFVFAFGMGLFGIALATVISRLPALLYATLRARHHERLRLAELPGEVRDAEPGPSAPATRSILRLSVPASLTFALTAGEGAVVNGLLARLPDSTSSIASYGVYYQLLMVALMPGVASSVAVLPFVARAVPEGQGREVVSDLWKVGAMAAIFGLALTLPAAFLFPTAVAGFFVKDGGAGVPTDPATVAVLRLLPLGVLAALPFLLLRSVFEALNRPRIGVLVSVSRFVVFSLPALFAGRALAHAAGFDPLLGIVGGVIVASALASAVTTHRAMKLLLARIT